MSFTYKPKKRKRAKTHGFLVRSKSKYGRNTIKRRRQTGRKKLTVQSKKGFKKPFFDKFVIQYYNYLYHSGNIRNSFVKFA